jgi:ABC-type multidrug transport system ATPase subunit/ABC-type multidrug transport system permease subunit
MLLRSAAGLSLNGARTTGGSTTLVGEGLSEAAQLEMSRWPRLVSLSTQFDNHFGLLTVRETLGMAEHLARPLSVKAEEWPALTASQVSSALGLDLAMDTRLGTETARGVSGGEARRVSVAETLVAPCRVWMLDSFSDGLDAARTKAITSGLLTPFARILHGTVVAVLQQPAQELFDMFDDVILMRDGHCLYSGPRESAASFFEDTLGCVRPDGISEPEFLAGISSEPEAFEVGRSKDAPLADVALNTTSLVEAFGRHAPTVAPSRDELGGSAVDMAKARRVFGSRHARNWCCQVVPLLGREVTTLFRDKQFLRAHFVRAIVLAIALGTLFNGLTADSFIQRISLMFFSCLVLAMGAVAELPIAVSNKQIVDRQARVSHMHHPTAYAAAVSLVYLPVAALETILYVAPMYYLTNFANNGAAFGIFFTAVYALVLSMVSTFRTFAWMAGSLEVALAFLAPFLAIFTMFSGFLATKSNLGWGALGQAFYWFTPVAWTIRTMSLNEFLSSEYDENIRLPGPPPPAPQHYTRRGDAYLTTYEIDTDSSWIGWGLLYTFGFALFMMLLGGTVFTCRVINEPRGTRRRLAKAVVAKKSSDEAVVGGEIEMTPSAADKPPSARATIDKTPSVAAIKADTTRDSEGTTSEKDDAKGDVVVAVTATRSSSHFGAITSAEKGHSLCWRGISFDVRLPSGRAIAALEAAEGDDGVPEPAKGHKRLLTEVSGLAKPGRVLALCGESGAGKTTLLNTLAGRTVAQGHVRGTILLGGEPISAEELRSRVGYVEQFDRHLTTATVREALEFSAWARLTGHVTAERVAGAVDEALDLLELRPVEFKAIGDEKLGAGLSRGERKRVTIGVELVADPKVLFLDEPTTALSATQARDVARVVRRVASSGRTVICTLHQPSAGVWYLMDDVLLLARGGYTVFAGALGHRSKDLVKYLEALPGSHPKPPAMNPADFMLDVIGSEAKESEEGPPSSSSVAMGGSEALASVSSVARGGSSSSSSVAMGGSSSRQQQLVKAFQASGQFKELQSVLDEQKADRKSSQHLLAKGASVTTTHVTAKRLSFCGQFQLLFVRAWRDFLRDTEFSMKRAVLFVVLALICGGVFFQIVDDDQAGVMSLVGGMVLGVIFVAVISANTTAISMQKRRPSYTREQAAHTYSPTAYGLAVFCAMAPWCALFSILFTLPYAAMVGYDYSIVPFILLVVFLTCLSYSLIALALGMLSETPQLVTAILSVVIALGSLFGGFFQPRADIPPGWIWAHYIVPLAYSIEAVIPAAFVCTAEGPLATNARGPCATINAIDDGQVLQNIPKLDYVERFYGLEADNRWRAVGILVGYAVVVQALFTYALWRIRARSS